MCIIYSPKMCCDLVLDVEKRKFFCFYIESERWIMLDFILTFKKKKISEFHSEISSELIAEFV